MWWFMEFAKHCQIKTRSVTQSGHAIASELCVAMHGWKAWLGERRVPHPHPITTTTHTTFRQDNAHRRSSASHWPHFPSGNVLRNNLLQFLSCYELSPFTLIVGRKEALIRQPTYSNPSQLLRQSWESHFPVLPPLRNVHVNPSGTRSWNALSFALCTFSLDTTPASFWCVTSHRTSLSKKNNRAFFYTWELNWNDLGKWDSSAPEFSRINRWGRTYHFAAPVAAASRDDSCTALCWALLCAGALGEVSSMTVLPTSQPPPHPILFPVTEKAFLFCFAFDKCLLHVYSVPGTIIGTGEKMMNKIQALPLIIA